MQLSTHTTWRAVYQRKTALLTYLAAAGVRGVECAQIGVRFRARQAYALTWMQATAALIETHDDDTETLGGAYDTGTRRRERHTTQALRNKTFDTDFRHRYLTTRQTLDCDAIILIQ